MAFKTHGFLTHDYSKPVLMEVPVSNLTLANGALVTKAAASASIAKVSSNTGTVWGVTNGAVKSSDKVVTVELCPRGTVFLADIKEIRDGAALTLTGGSTTTAVIGTMVAGTDGVFVGMRFVVVSAANSQLNGSVVTVTGYTSSTGTLSFSALPAALTAGDTIRILSLDGRHVAGWTGVGIDTTNADSVVLNQNSSSATLFRCIGTDEEGKRLKLVLRAGIDS